MTPKELWNDVKDRVNQIETSYDYDYDCYATYRICLRHIMDDEEIETVSKSLTELEELKRDVNRYFELRGKYLTDISEVNYYVELEERLLKVGKE